MHCLILFIIALAQLAWSRCECGYTMIDSENQPIFMNRFETDFTLTNSISENPDWKRQQFRVSAEAGHGEYGKSFRSSNVVILPGKAGADKSTNTSLGLRVGGIVENGAVSTAEIDTVRSNFWWGSYRAVMKLTDVNGTCAAFFWYFNDTQEIDIEFLSREFKPTERIFPVNLVVQSKQSREAGYDASKTGTFKRVNLSFDPTADFHEYRLDYLPGRVTFYADGQRIAIMDGSNMPSMGGYLIFQHWSNGNALWSGGPPEKDAWLSVGYVRAYFNSSNEQDQTRSWHHCHDKGIKATLCEIPSVTEENASNSGGSSSIDEIGVQPELENGEESGAACLVVIMIMVVIANLWVFASILPEIVVLV